MAEYALNYAPSVKALLGAIMDYLGCGDSIVEPLRQSLNGNQRKMLIRKLAKSILLAVAAVLAAVCGTPVAQAQAYSSTTIPPRW